MKSAWLFTLLALLAAAATFGAIIYAGAPYMPVVVLLTSTPIMLKLGEQVLALLLILVLIVGLGEFAGAKNAAGSGFLRAMAWLATGFGALLLVYRLYIVHLAMERTNTTNLRVVAPSVAEGMSTLTLGLIVALIAAWLNVAIMSRSRKRKAAAALA